MNAPFLLCLIWTCFFPINYRAAPVLAPLACYQLDERININTATAAELTRLPGVGPTLAANIVEHRRKHGPFKRPQEIVIVRRVSAKLYRQIAHLIRI